MDRIFGLLLLVVYVAAIVGLSAGVTFLVIKLFPVKSKPSEPDEPSNDGGGPAGKLFRRAKRETA
ncbi:MAG TPA: hypothetical protein VFK76_10340 [Gaiellaceae bacterium]|nr:hypothetical protein [Gaiellaceae bacterium]